MVAGHLQEKKGYYYAVLSYKDADKRRRTKWIASGLPVKGNKKKAEGFLQEQRRSFEIPLADQPIAKDGQELFADYLQRWLPSRQDNGCTDHLWFLRRAASESD